MTINLPVFPRRPIQHCTADYTARKNVDGWELYCCGEGTGIICTAPDECLARAARLMAVTDVAIGQWDSVFGDKVLGKIEGRDYRWEE